MRHNWYNKRILIDLLLIAIIIVLFVIVIGLVQKECMNIRAPKKIELKNYRFGSSKMRSCAIAIIGYRLETELKDSKTVTMEYPGIIDQITKIPDLIMLRDHTLWRLATCEPSEFNVLYWYKIGLLEKENYLFVIRKWNKDKKSFKKGGFASAIELIGKDTIEFIDKSKDLKLSRANDTTMIKFLGWPEN